MSDHASSICGRQVRAEDPDRFFAGLFLPAAIRADAYALFAFDLEVAKIADSVSEPMLGEIRLQWWRDAIERDEAGGHPVAQALLDTVRRVNLDRGRFLSLLEARAFDLYRDPMPNRQALEGYVRETSCPLFEGVARLLAPGRLPAPCVAAAGRAYGRTRLLQRLPWQVMRGQLLLPLDVLSEFQLPPDHVLAHRNSPALGLVLTAMRALVRRDLAEMRAGLRADDPATMACLPAFLCEPVLRAMERANFDPFKTPVSIPLWRRQVTLWWWARRLPTAGTSTDRA